MNIWISSDFHLGHKNLVLGCTEWENKAPCRNFETLKEHDTALLEGINKYVKENDILYFLGDFAMGGKPNVWKYRELINCRTIHLCLGNHDLHIEKDARLHGEAFTARQLFSSVQYRIQKKISGKRLVMDHYAMRTWDKAHHGAIMLHGHSHGSLIPYEKLLQIADDKQLYKTGDLYKQMDVGIDCSHAMYGEWRPFHIGEIIEIMEHRLSLGVDHHQENEIK